MAVWWWQRVGAFGSCERACDAATALPPTCRASGRLLGALLLLLLLLLRLLLAMEDWARVVGRAGSQRVGWSEVEGLQGVGV